MHHSKGFYTLNSIGTAFCPYRVVHEASFVKDLDALGYRATDRWANPGKGLHLPFEDGYDVPAYRGGYFERPTGQ
jgi:putative methyltransferase (TIGR04325 family)